MAGVPIIELRSSDLVLSLLISTIFAGLHLSILTGLAGLVATAVLPHLPPRC